MPTCHPRPSPSRWFHRFAWLGPAHLLPGIAGLSLIACGGGDSLLLPSEGAPTTITVKDGNNQSAKVTEPLSKLLVVRVADSRDRPVEGAIVTFDFSGGGPGADVTPHTATTDANGEASARPVLGTRIGQQTGTARIGSDPGGPSVTFQAFALPENANLMAAVGGEDQTGRVGAPLDRLLVVEVTDVFGNPISGVPISWSAEGGGSVSETLVNTDDQGRAAVQRILGPAAGQQTTVASSANLAGSPVTFVHTAVAGNASLLTIVSGDNQIGQVGAELSADLVVRLIDGDGNGVPNTAVAWVVAIGGGTATPANSNTDGEGRASARWALGSTPGAQRLDAVVSGVGVVSFDAIATAGAPAALAIRTQPPGSARNGVRFERAPVIQLRDAGGNEVASGGVPVSVALGAGSGDLSGARTRLTDGNGRATFDDLAISGSAGRYTLVFSSSGYASVTSSAIDLRAISTTTAITSDSPDPSAPGAPVTVEFRVTSDGATPDGIVTVSDGVDSCTGDLSGGAGRCQIALTRSGQRTLRATYSGGPGLGGSSDTETHTVASAPPPPPGATVTTITDDSPDPTVSGATFTVRFTVTASGTTPTGSVTVTVSGGSPRCTGALTGGSGSCDITLNTVGDRTLTATYSGAPGLAPSSDIEPHRVDEAPPQNQAPFADFNWHCEDLTCHFTDASRDEDGNQTIVSRHWDFGDGATVDNELNPSHSYAAEGNYRVTLRVTDNGGLSDDSEDTVDPTAPRNEAPHADFEVECPNEDLTCTFTDKSNDDDGTVQAWHWEFGDGQSFDGQSPPPHTYSVEQKYQVTLTVTDDRGGTDSRSRDAEPKAPPPPPENQPPTATDDAATTDAGAAVTINVLENDNDPEGVPLAVSLVSGPVNGGTAGVNSDGTITYMPASGFSGTDTFVYRVSDGSLTDDATVTVTVNPPPTP